MPGPSLNSAFGLSLRDYMHLRKLTLSLNKETLTQLSAPEAQEAQGAGGYNLSWAGTCSMGPLCFTKNGQISACRPCPM